MRKTHIIRNLILGAVCLSMLLSLSACGESKVSQKQISAMDTEITITAYGKNAEIGINQAVGVINAIEAAIDPKTDTSYVYAMNRAEGNQVVVPWQVADMILRAQEINKRANHSIDLTIYPLIKLWGFEDHQYYVPSALEIENAVKKLHFREVSVNSFPSSGTYSVTMPHGTEITLAAVGKGSASQNAIEALRQSGVTSGIVSMDGSVQTLGVKPDGSEWNVAVRDPKHTGNYLGVLNLGEAAVSTTVSYLETFTDINGSTYHHIINPQSGYPTSNSLVSATVICDNGTDADALSTAMFVLGQSRALNYWRTYGGFDMVLVNSAGEITCTSGLIEHFTLTNTEEYTLRYTE